MFRLSHFLPLAVRALAADAVREAIASSDTADSAIAVSPWTVTKWQLPVGRRQYWCPGWRNERRKRHWQKLNSRQRANRREGK